MGTDTTRYVVLKFGGTSVSTVERWATIARQAQRCVRDGERPVIVCSALAGISNLLEALPERALAGEADACVDAIAAPHRALADAMGVALPADVETWLEELRRKAQGIALLGEASPRIRASLLAGGELASTRLGAAWLASTGVDVTWTDARNVLRARPDGGSERRRWLAASCDDAFREDVRTAVDALPGAILLTQGFIASDEEGETVLLGRGGSDTSAALIAATLGATRCEIWTDVPGLFTANPRQVPEARLLRHVDYDEAQEIASTGARVLHPRCIAPVRRHRIPLVVRSTLHPELEGTMVSHHALNATPQVKAVSTKMQVLLVSMETEGMWQQVGFLADVFGVFRTLGLSVDLVSTSEMNVTVSLDPTANALDQSTQRTMLEQLAPYCRPRLISPAAAVSLVGSGIRSTLHRLGGVFQQFEEQRIHLMSQAASDLNLTLVVDEDRAEPLLRRLHGELFQQAAANPVFGPTWRELFGELETNEVSGAEVWWRRRRDELLRVAESTSPCFVYDLDEVARAANALRSMASVDRVFYAVKANPHPAVLQTVEACGLSFECVSPGELRRVRDVLGARADGRLLYTPNFASPEELRVGFEEGAVVTLDALHPLQHWPELFRGREIFVRVDPGRGRGHHAHVRTAGAQSKFGIEPDQLEAFADLARRAGVRVTGLHAHAGSGIRTPDAWQETAVFLEQARRIFPDVRTIDVGGGLGVPEKPGQEALDLARVDAGIAAFRAAHPDLAIWMEPGRYLIASAGVLLARVTQCKSKGDIHYVGTNVGMNSLIRPALYGAWHEIVNLTRLDDEATQVVQVVGPICETGDVLGRNRTLPPPREGDILLIATAGAYGRAMSSHYNLREPAAEVILERT